MFIMGWLNFNCFCFHYFFGLVFLLFFSCNPGFPAGVLPSLTSSSAFMVVMTFPPSPVSFFSRSAVSLSMISSFFLPCELWTYHFPLPLPLLLNMGCLKVLNLKSITGSHLRIRTMHFLLSSLLTSSGVISSLLHCQVINSISLMGYSHI